MAENDDESQKTEDPTDKRLRDALEKGQVINSKEVGTFFAFLCLSIIIFSLGPSLLAKMTSFLKIFISDAFDFYIDGSNLNYIFKKIIINFFLLIIFPLSALIIVSILSSYFQMGNFVFSFESITPKLEKLSLIKGLKRIFSFKSIFEFLKGILKIIIISIILFAIIYPHLSEVNNLYNLDIKAILAIYHKIIANVFIASTAILAIIAIADYLYQRYEYFKSLRMTKQEVKEEFKQTEGSPEIKAKLKKIRNERARNRMMQSIPDSDVIITNPTHYSIALKYDQKTMKAPKLVAKGLDLIALKIREIAKEHSIPLYENPILARTLYKDVEIEQEVPVKYYKAVAEVISYVYNLQKNK